MKEIPAVMHGAQPFGNDCRVILQAGSPRAARAAAGAGQGRSSRKTAEEKSTRAAALKNAFSEQKNRRGNLRHAAKIPDMDEMIA